MGVRKAQTTFGEMVICFVLIFFLFFTPWFVWDSSTPPIIEVEVVGKYDSVAHLRDIETFEALSNPAANPTETYKLLKEKEMIERIEKATFGD